MDSKDLQRYRLRLSYDGTDFYGWQKQPNVEPTIQGLLEGKLSQIYNQKIAVVGSGRTDRGVHALNQWAHFDLPPSADASNLRYKLQRMTPDSLSIKSVESCPDDFHAQISAVTKCYFYRIRVAPIPTPIGRNFSWQRTLPLDEALLEDHARVLLGEHDFSSFQSKGTPVSTPVRRILISRWVQRTPGILEFQIQGNGFLKQMVRNIVGTMISLHDRKATPEVLKELILKKNRQVTAAPAPALGLFLSSVQYPKDLDNKCRKL